MTSQSSLRIVNDGGALYLRDILNDANLWMDAVCEVDVIMDQHTDTILFSLAVFIALGTVLFSVFLPFTKGLRECRARR